MSTFLAEYAAHAVMAVSALALLVLVGWLLRVERAGTGAADIHAHDDGTVHEHFRGSAPHRHPTALERYDGWLSRWLGPAAVDRH